jgi:hypothetical protein
MHKKDHIIVGISRVHNSAVTLLKNGEIVFHLENERLSNIKYDAYVFQTLAKLPEYVDHVDDICIAGVGPTVPVENFTKDNVYTTFIARLNKNFFSKDYNVYDLWNHHHKVHAACAFYNSGFSQAVCVIKDGMGSDYPIADTRFQTGTYGRETSTTFLASYPDIFEVVDKTVSVPFEANVVIDGNVKITNAISEALAFQKTSKHFGFHELDAGKVMGMSSYGKSTGTNPPIFKNNQVNTELFKPTQHDLRTVEVNTKIAPHLIDADFTTQANFAYDLQQQTQAEIKSYILDMVEQTGCKNVCLSGGYFLNCVANYEFLKDLPPNKRKTILSALVVISNNNDYRKEMLGDIKEYSDDMKTHEKSKTQKDNWISKDELHQIYNSLKAESNLLYKKEKKTMTDLQSIQDFIIICLLGGIFIPPRRSLDYCCFKIKTPYDVDKDNYIIKNETGSVVRKGNISNIA